MKAEAWQLVTGPASEPLGLAEAKRHLRVDGDDEDVLILEYASAARAWCEEYLGRALATQTWDAWFSAWPEARGFELPLPPLASVTSVKYTLEGQAQATLATSVYSAITAEEPGRVVLKYDQDWPDGTLDAGLPIVVRFVCGYGPGAAPTPIKQALRWLVGHMHENREAVTVGSLAPQQVPMTARWSLDPYRVRYVW